MWCEGSDVAGDKDFFKMKEDSKEATRITMQSILTIL